MRNGRTFSTRNTKRGFGNALDMNKLISQVYYLKEQLLEIWAQVDMSEVEKGMENCVRRTKESEVAQLVNMAAAIIAHIIGISE